MSSDGESGPEDQPSSEATVWYRMDCEGQYLATREAGRQAGEAMLAMAQRDGADMVIADLGGVVAVTDGYLDEALAWFVPASPIGLAVTGLDEFLGEVLDRVLSRRGWVRTATNADTHTVSAAPSGGAA